MIVFFKIMSRNSAINVQINGEDNVSPVLSSIVSQGVVLGNAISGSLSLAGDAIGGVFDVVKGNLQSALDVQMNMIGTSGALMGILGTDYNQAKEVTKELNREFTAMASTLPGVTEDFAAIGLSISDDIFNSIRNADGSVDLPNAKKLLLEMTEGWGLLAQQSATSSAEASQNLVRFLGGDASVLQMAQFDKSPAFKSALNRVMEADNASLEDWQSATTEQRARWINEASKMTIPKEAIDELRTTVDGVFQGWRSAVFDPTTGALGFLREIESRDGGTIMSALSDTMQAADSLFKSLADNFPLRFDVLAPLFDTFKFLETQITRATSLISDGISIDTFINMGTAVNQMMGDLRAKSIEMMVNLFNGLADSLGNIQTSIPDLSGMVSGFMSNLFSDVGMMITGTLNNLNFSGMIDGLKNVGLLIVNSLSTMVEGLADSISMDGIQGLFMGFNLGERLGQIVGETLMALAELAASSMGTVDLATVLGALSTVGQIIIGAFVGFIKGVGSAIVAGFPSYVSAITEAMERSRANINSAFSSAASAVQGIVRTGVNGIVESVKSLIDRIVQAFKAAIPSAMSAISNAVNSLRSAVSSITGQANAASQQAASTPTAATPAPTTGATPATATPTSGSVSEPGSRTAYINQANSQGATPLADAAELQALQPQNSFNGNLKPLLDAIRLESMMKPYGSNLTVANSSETILNRSQTRRLANSMMGSNGSQMTVNLNVNGVSNPNAVADLVMRRLDNLVTV